MNDSRGNVRQDTGGLLVDPGRIAPALDKAWRDAFIVELRLLGVPGTEIGDALVTAHSHVEESSESATDAFGDPRAYAREIAASRGTAPEGWRLGALTVSSIATGLLGMLAGVWAVNAWVDGGHVTITVGHLAALAALAALTTGLALRPEAVLRFAVEHRWLSALAPVVLLGVVAGLFLVLGQPVGDVSWTVLAVLGVVALVVGTVTGWLDSDPEADEILAPGEAHTSSTTGRLAALVPLPLLTVLMCGVTWLLGRAT